MILVCTPEEFMASSPEVRRKLVLAQIDATPELWDQRYWKSDCGTYACYAGWAVTLAGGNLLEIEDPDIRETALDLLNLESESAAILFAASNERADLGAMIEAINKGAKYELRAAWATRVQRQAAEPLEQA